jgi:hypothetical protein
LGNALGDAAGDALRDPASPFRMTHSHHQQAPSALIFFRTHEQP